MPLDPSIILGAKPPEFESPTNALMKVLQVGNAMQEGDLNRYKLQTMQEDRNQLNALARVAGDPQYIKDGRYDLGAIAPAAYQAAPGKAGGFIKDLVDQQEKQAKAGNERAQMTKHHYALMDDFLAGIAADPRPQTVNGMLDKWEAVTGIQAGPTRQVFSSLTDPTDIRNMALRMRLAAKDQLPKERNVDTGGSILQQNMDPVTGQISNVGTLAKTPTPGERMTDARGWAQLSQAERHFQADQNTPQYMQTEEGIVALPKKPGPGPITATPVVGATGQPLTKPLKDIPASANAAIVANAQNLKKAEDALNLIRGANVGGMKGDANATGWKGYLPNTLLNSPYGDPEGVDTRAAIADLGSMVIHDRSGTAVTAAEFPRLAPFVPRATDDPATVEKKLARFVDAYRAEIQAQNEIYSRDQGYKPNPVAQRASKGSGNPTIPEAPALPVPSAPGALRHGVTYRLPNGKTARYDASARTFTEVN